MQKSLCFLTLFRETKVFLVKEATRKHRNKEQVKTSKKNSEVFNPASV